MSNNQDRCEDCGGIMGAHRGHCHATDSPDDKHWQTCDCGERIHLLPISNYMVDDWGGCHIDHLCPTCPLHNSDALLKRVIATFGEHPGSSDNTRIIPEEIETKKQPPIAPAPKVSWLTKFLSWLK